MKKPILLAILDGYGLNDNENGNAIKAAKTPNMDKYFEKYPNTRLMCSGMAVGLPDGQMGNSEVGHTNIGAGRVVYQELTRISKSIDDGEFFENDALIKASENCLKSNSAMHIMGLVSDGGVHSHNTHLYALLKFAKEKKIENVYIHCFLDGRDVPPKSGKDFILELENEIKNIGCGKIATVMGRFYAMDRDNRWDRVKKAYDAMIFSKGDSFENAAKGVQISYDNELTDEFVIPFFIKENDKPVGKISKDDSIVFFNFRPDRAREITRSIVEESFEGFEREYFSTHFVCMTQYDVTMPNVHVAFKPQTLNNTFGQYISSLGLKQLRIAETEKYAHVTFFFNGGVEKVYENEDRVLIPSPKVATYDMKPEMSALEVKDAVVEKIKLGIYDVIVLNFANCDMVGHTGFMDKAQMAVETVDKCIGQVVDAVNEMGGVTLITADHGNSDQMIDYETGSPFTAHTTNPVPLIIIGLDCSLRQGKLSDLAPTMLDMMDVEIPSEMTGKSLIIK